MFRQKTVSVLYNRFSLITFRMLISFKLILAYQFMLNSDCRLQILDTGTNKGNYFQLFF